MGATSFSKSGADSSRPGKAIPIVATQSQRERSGFNMYEDE
jgi:hypothetical protein